MKKILFFLVISGALLLTLNNCQEPLENSLGVETEDPPLPAGRETAPPEDESTTLNAPPGERREAPTDTPTDTPTEIPTDTPTEAPADETTEVILLPKISPPKTPIRVSKEGVNNLEIHNCIKDNQEDEQHLTYFFYEPGSGNRLCELYFSRSHLPYWANHQKDYCRTVLITEYLIPNIKEKGFKCSCTAPGNPVKTIKILEGGSVASMCGKLCVKKPIPVAEFDYSYVCEEEEAAPENEAPQEEETSAKGTSKPS